MTGTIHHHPTWKSVLLFLLLLPGLVLAGCRRGDGPRFREVEDLKPQAENRLDRIREEGVLRVVTEFNSISYFIYRGQPMGFQFEMLQELANHMGLELEVSVSNDLEQNFRDLEEGKVDLIAMNLTVTADRRQKVAFCLPLLQTRQVLVQTKPDHWEDMNYNQLESSVIRNQLDLSGKTVYVQAGSVYAQRLRSLADEIGGEIEIREVQLDSEQLVQRVALGEIEYTICDENVGIVNSLYFPVLDVGTAISFPQNVAWAVHLRSDSLRMEINRWLEGYRISKNYALIYNKYFKNRHSYRNIHSEFYTLGSGKISRYDEQIKKEAERIGWDWRLLASIIFQESRFNPEAESWAGAYGLMQLMPATARHYGISRSSPPSAQIRAGADFLKWLDDRFKSDIEEKDERIRFVLASYNIGYGHIQDARRLAEKYGEDPNVWQGSVENWLLKKSDPAYYTDQVVQFGYARGLETYNFVKEVMERYEHYRNIVNSNVIAAWKPIEEIRLTSSQ